MTDSMPDYNAYELAALEQDLDHALKKDPPEPSQKLDWVSGFSISMSEAEAMSNSDFLFPNLIIRGHVGAYPAEPGAGKTTIFRKVAGEMAADGMQVFYVNADTSGGDAKEMVEHAQENNYTMLLPDLAGRSMDEIVSNLAMMNEIKADYSDMVFIFDTLKKMTDVINKSRSKELYKLFRGLSGKGMTIILLAHTNKYKDADGKPIYEGTGDLRSDVDELIYLIPKKNDDGSMTVSTLPDKTRGKFEPITFEISADREVALQEKFIDVLTIRQMDAQREHDQVSIEAITESINNGSYKHVQIRDYCKANHNLGWRTVESALKRYSQMPNRLWRREKGFQHNAWVYYLNNSTPPIKDNTGESGDTGQGGYTQ